MVEPRLPRLPPKEREVAEMNGGIKYIERAVMPRVSRLTHFVSCVQPSPPPEAHSVCRSTIYIMYQNKHEGITFGGAKLGKRVVLKGGMYANLVLEDGAPLELEGHADTTTCDRAVYALAVTYNGGIVAHAVKKIRGIVPDSCFSEMRGSTYASETVEIARHALTVYGHPPDGPTILGTDNSAHLAISMGTANPSRVKPNLGSWAPLKDRIHRKIVHLTKIDTAVMPVDFLTKWIKFDRMIQQLTYLINAAHAVWPG